MNVPQDRDDHAALNDRMGYLFGIRMAVAVVTLIGGASGRRRWACRTARSLRWWSPTPRSRLRGRAATLNRFNYSLLTVMLLIDGAFLATAMYVTGRDAEPDPVPHLPAPRRGVAAGLVSDRPQGRAVGLAAAVRRPVCPGRAPRPGGGRRPRPRDRVRPHAAPERDVVLAVRARDVGLLGDERARAPPAPGRSPDARRHRRSARRRARSGPQSRIVLDGLAARFGFERGVVLGATEGQLVVLASLGVHDAPTTPPTPTRSSPSHGRARPAAGPPARPGATRCSRRSCRAPGTCWCRRWSPTAGRSARSSSNTGRAARAASSGGSRRCSRSSSRSPRSTSATPSCCAMSRTSPSATR